MENFFISEKMKQEFDILFNNTNKENIFLGAFSKGVHLHRLPDMPKKKLQKRSHKKRRINKKWAKKYGYKEIEVVFNPSYSKYKII